MKQVKKDDQQKILLVFILLIVLLIGIVVLRNYKAMQLKNQMEPSQYPPITEIVKIPQGRMQVVMDREAQVGGKIKAQVSIQTDGRELFGSDAILLYDPQYLEVADENDLVTGDYFENFPRRQIDAENGVIKVTGFSPSTSILDEVKPLFSVSFTALKAGQTTVSIDFEKDSTNTSTLVERGTSQNILEEVVNADLTIVE